MCLIWEFEAWIGTFLLYFKFPRLIVFVGDINLGNSKYTYAQLMQFITKRRFFNKFIYIKKVKIENLVRAILSPLKYSTLKIAFNCVIETEIQRYGIQKKNIFFILKYKNLLQNYLKNMIILYLYFQPSKKKLLV